MKGYSRKMDDDLLRTLLLWYQMETNSFWERRRKKIFMFLVCLPSFYLIHARYLHSKYHIYALRFSQSEFFLLLVHASVFVTHVHPANLRLEMKKKSEKNIHTNFFSFFPKYHFWSFQFSTCVHRWSVCHPYYYTYFYFHPQDIVSYRLV